MASYTTGIMSDIYHIPGDNGKDFRLKKFVEYQHEVPETHYRLVGEYAKRGNLCKDEIINLAFILSVTYSEITTIFVRELMKKISPEIIWERYKNTLIFGSARKYAKNNDEFVPLIEEWREVTRKGPYSFVKNENTKCGEETYRRLHRTLMSLHGCGRFSADLFLETLIYLKEELELNVEQPSALDWRECSNLTSGIFNIFYEDEKANEYERTRRLSNSECAYLSSRLRRIKTEIEKTYPEQNSEVCMFIGKICSFRNLFKKARYGGFHHDRQLGVLKQYENAFPEYGYLWSECYEIRKAIFPNRFLGELNGWDGIRKERKKLWLEKGLTGVEK